MRQVLLYFIDLYRKYLSPMKRTKCPYVPSCSAYGAEAIRRYGALTGSALALWRIVRCNPFSKGGFDPVPVRTGRIIYKERKR
ncbi:MAG: membrane protein insertion efficiency factor YidD [Lachnospiraceae bacterium]|nr:membrane protein insertion efficiency factor YidD [Lachnospiraceae bacterium]